MGAITEYLKVIFSVNQEDVDKFNKSLKDADQAAKDLDKSLDDAGKNDGPQKLSDGFDNVVKGVKAFIAIGIVKELASIAIEASKVAAAGEGVRSAFSNLGGSQADLKRLSNAIGGTVSNIKLMEFAVKAMQKGLNMDQVVKTLQLVDKQATATGGSFDAMGDKMIKSIDNVPEFVEQVDKKLVQLGGTASRAGDAYGKIAAQQENIQEAFGRLINSKGFIKVQEFFGTQLGNIADFLEGKDFGLAGKSIEELDKQMANVIDKLNEARSGRSWNEALFGDNIDRKLLIADLEREQEAILKMQLSLEQAEKNKKAKELLDKEEAAKRYAAFVLERNQMEKEQHQKFVDELFTIDMAYLDKLIKSWEEKAPIFPIEPETDALKEADEKLKKSQEQRSKSRLLLLKGAGGRINEEVKGLEKKQGTLPAELSKESEKVKIDFEAAALSVFSMVDALASLGDSNSSKGKKFFAVVQGLLGIASIAFPAVKGIGIAAAGVGTLGRLVAKNEGGWIPGLGPDRDSILLHATPGEFVTRRSSAQRSPLLLDAINAGELDDKIFSQLINAPVINLNQEQVVAAIERIPQPDLYKSGSALYEFRKMSGERNVNRKRRLMP